MEGQAGKGKRGDQRKEGRKEGRTEMKEMKDTEDGRTEKK